MRIAWLLVLIAYPLLEIGLLIKVGQSIGFWPTLAIVIGTTIGGSAVIANQGLSSPFKVQEAVLRGEAPLATVVDGALIVLAGTLLITPGLIADAAGLLLLVPQIRQLLIGKMQRSMFGTPQAGTAPRTGDSPEAPPGGEGGPIIEGEFERIDERSMDAGRRRSDDRTS